MDFQIGYGQNLSFFLYESYSSMSQLSTGKNLGNLDLPRPSYGHLHNYCLFGHFCTGQFANFGFGLIVH